MPIAAESAHIYFQSVLDFHLSDIGGFEMRKVKGFLAVKRQNINATVYFWMDMGTIWGSAGSLSINIQQDTH